MSRVSSSRHVRLFKNGKNQAVRIPREFELPGEEAVLHRDEEGRLILEPFHPKDLLAMLAGWTALEDKDSVAPIEDLPPEPIRL